MNDLIKKVVLVNIEEELKCSYLDYAMSVIVGRALPDVRDGLKPVHRRILFAMSTLGNDWNKPYKKSARVVGDVIGKYHPHGDTAVYDAIVRMAQPFSLRYMLIDGQGNFGSIDGDSAAAMRYTEVRMAKIAHEMLADLEKETVDYLSNYDGTEKIPNVMPTRVPNLLINGSSGIAVGMATNIPPHNLMEVINGCLAFIKDTSISVERLMEYIPGPDFPTAAIIGNQRGIQDAYRTGKGKIYIRAYAKIEKDTKTGREAIIVHEIPYQVNKARLVEKIAELVKIKRIEGISGLRDESDKDGMRIVIEIKRDAIGEIVLNNLYSLTQLQIPFSINMVALHQGKPKTLSLKEILSSFVHHRREVITRRTIFELNKAKNRASMLEALAVAMENVDPIITLIRQAKTLTEAKSFLVSRSWFLSTIPTLVLQANGSDEKNCRIHEVSPLNLDRKYSLNEEQAQAILDLKLQKLTRIEQKKLLDEYKQILEKIKELTHILHNPNCLTEVICKELITIKEQYSDSRRTQIVTDISNINVEDRINQENVVVTLSHQGYVKYQPLKDYDAQRRGGKGKSATSMKEKDFIDRLLIANTHDTLLLFSSRGRMYWIKVYQLPKASRGSLGRPIVNLLPLEGKERITAILALRDYEKGRHVFMATTSGTVKKIPLIECSRPRNSGIMAVHLNDGDELIGVDVTDGTNEVMLFSAYGKVVRFMENQVRSMGRTATGLRGIQLATGDRVVSLIVPRPEGFILTVTQHGYGKCTSQKEYPTKSRATRGVISIKVSERNGEVIGAVQVNNCDQIMIITDTGTLVRIRVSEVSIIGRNTQGVRLIRTLQNEQVVGVQRVIESVEDKDLM